MRYVFALVFTVLGAQVLFAQIPNVTIQDVSGRSFDTSTLSEHDGPIVVSFWAMWCKPCIQELMSINDMYIDLQDDYNLELFAVSIDDARNATKVKSFVNGKAWDYTVLLDQNSDLKRAMNVNNVPHTFLMTPDGEIVKQHTSYVPGDEEILYEEIEKLYTEMQNEANSSQTSKKTVAPPSSEQLQQKYNEKTRQGSDQKKRGDNGESDRKKR